MNFPPNPNTMFFKPVSTPEILSIVRNLKNKQSCGYDGPTTNIIKECIHLIVAPLCSLVNSSL
ncbi:hypothetical protein HHI36_014617, partial [Cryptolaemus montrouzieri]